MSLLLLPVLSPPVRRSSWWAAYRSTIEQILQTLRPVGEHEIARLDIAIVLTSSFKSTTRRTAFFSQFQDILREVYSLVCASAAQKKIELDFPGGVDARVFFLDARSTDVSPDVVGKQQFSGPIIDLQTFVDAKRPYQVIYCAECEAGEGVLKELLELWRNQGTEPDIQRLPCGTSMSTSGQELDRNSEGNMSTSHKSVAVGGTFDHLHIGHKLLLAATVYMAQPTVPGSLATKRKITIGITGDELLVNKKHGSLVESWEERQQRTAELVDSLLVFNPNIASVRTVQETDQPGPNGKVVKVTYGNDVEINYTRISDPFGPTITDEAITALIISAETRAGGKAVNDKRVERGWHALEVFEVDVLDAAVPEEYGGAAADGQTFDSKISSTDIRRRLEAKARSSNGHL